MLRLRRAALADDERLDGSMRASVLSLLAPPLCYLGRPAEAYALAQEAVGHAESAVGRSLSPPARPSVRTLSLYAEVVPTTEELADVQRASGELRVPAGAPMRRRRTGWRR